MGKRVSDEELSEFIAEVDMDGEGQIDFEEFLEMLVNLQEVRQNRLA